MAKAVIFDRDGIIIDSELVNVNSAVSALKTLGIEIKEEEKKCIIGRHPDDYNKDFLKNYEYPSESFRKIQRKNYHKLFDTAPLFEDIITLIKKLKGVLPTALTTASSMRSTKALLKRAKLEDSFDVIVTTEDYEKRKPAPDAYILTAKKLNIAPKDCVAIEDTSIGLQSAKKAGMKCIVIPTEFTKEQDFSQADMIIASGKDITIEMLKEM